MTEGENERNKTIVHTGWLAKKGRVIRIWRKRWFQLDSNGILEYYKHKETPLPAGVIHISEIIKISTRPAETGIEGPGMCLVLPTRTYYITAETRKEIQQWIAAIHQVLESMSVDLPQISPRGANQINEEVDEREDVQSYPTNQHTIEKEDIIALPILTNSRPEWNSFHQRSTQIKVFTRWMNHLLQKRSVQIADLSTDLCDGVALIHLTETLYSTTLETFHHQPSGNVQRMQNINGAMKFLRDKDIKLPIIPVESIIIGNIKSVMDLLWAVIFAIEIEKISFEGVVGTEALSRWIKDRTGSEITNFTSDFQDGIILCKLMYSYQLFGTNELLTKYKKRENISMAVEELSLRWNVPKLFDVDDILEEPDSISVIIYLAACFQALTAL